MRQMPMPQVCLFILLVGLCHGVSKATECTARGRFPNDDAEDCRGYTMCLLGGAAGFTQYKLTCPVDFVYSHLEQRCTNATSYKCLSSFVCNVTGNFENPLSINCSSYVACPGSLNGTVTARHVECPLDQVFDPQEAACVSSTEYKCRVGFEPVETTESFSEVPPVTTVPHNTTNFNIEVSGENGFQLSSSVSLSSSVDVCSEHTVLLAILFAIFVNVIY